MFRRNKTEPEPTPTTKAQGKGRPTPTRREAEAAARARAKGPVSRQDKAAARKAANQQMRRAMETGEERFLPARDRGPVKRFIRDYVDARLTFLELSMPLVMLALALNFINDATRQVSSVIVYFTMFMMVMNGVALRWGLRRELERRFPDEPTSGTTWYAISRAIQMRFLRMPKRQMRVGQPLPETYR